MKRDLLCSQHLARSALRKFERRASPPANPADLGIDSRALSIEHGRRMLGYLWVAIGGALGSIARYWVSGAVARQFGETFPWGTIAANVSGSFIIGLFAALTSTDGRLFVPPWFRQQFFMLGICGGYTTFSSFSLQTLNLMEDGEWLYAGGNVMLSVISCLVAVWLGHVLGTTINATSR